MLFFENLGIGKKIGWSFALIGLIFLAVVWQYHSALFQALDDYDHLRVEYGAKKSHFLNIHRYMLEARRSEKDFLARKKEKYIKRVQEFSSLVRKESEGLTHLKNPVGQHSGVEASKLVQSLIDVYEKAFIDIVEAWKIKGMDHKSGRQGSFRKSAHELESILNDFDVSQLKIDLGQLRRHEKDYVVRGTPKYVDKFNKRVGSFNGYMTTSRLSETLKNKISASLSEYQSAVDAYVNVRSSGEIPERDTPLYKAMSKKAHVIEDLLNTHYVANIWRDLLMVRRHEKDYLLREDPKYIKRLADVITTMKANIQASDVPKQNQTHLTQTLDVYQKDFLALVTQNDRIQALTQSMRDAVHKIEPMIAENVAEAIEQMDRLESETRLSSKTRAGIALIIALIAAVVATLLAVVITRLITKPIATLMEASERISGGDLLIAIDLDRQDEIGLLAASMNYMAATLRDVVHRMGVVAEGLDGASQELLSISSEMSNGAGSLTDRANSTSSSAVQMSTNMVSIAASAEQASTNLTQVAVGSSQASGNLGLISSQTNDTAGELSHVAETMEHKSSAVTTLADGARRANDDVNAAASAIHQVTASFSDVRGRCATADSHSKDANQHVQGAAEVMEKLSASAKEIDSVVEVINGIAEQTNMLALNASIEAAGAGEAGKGFAVVANEVKELARQTGDATRMIQKRATEIRNQSSEAMTAVKEAMNLIQEIAHANAEILRAVDEQSHAADEVAEAMSSAAGETTRVTDQLGDVADGVAETATQIVTSFQKMLEISTKVGQANEGLADISRNVEEASQGAMAITRSVNESAQTAGGIAQDMTKVTHSAQQIQIMSGTVDDKATVLSKLASEMKGLAGRFEV